MKHIAVLLSISACLLLLGCSSSAHPVQAAQGPRNIIIMVADGAGFNHFAAAAAHNGEDQISAIFRQFPVRLAAATYAAGGSYDPDKAWADPASLKSGATDSAAAATALSTGTKTKNGALGVDADEKSVMHLMEIAESIKKSTGVVTSVPFSHATPAGFIVHQAGRNSYGKIAEEMIQSSRTDVIIGCGHPMFDNQGRERSEPKFKYLDEKEWTALLDGRAGSHTDADQNGALDDSWTLIQSRAEF